MRNSTFSFALMACVALSVAPVQAHAQDELVATARVDSAAQDAFVAGTAMMLAYQALNVAAPGCCDQGYEIRNMAEQPGCCDQGYEVHSASAVPGPLLAVLVASVLLLLYTTTNHFKQATARWTLRY